MKRELTIAVLALLLMSGAGVTRAEEDAAAAAAASESASVESAEAERGEPLVVTSKETGLSLAFPAGTISSPSETASVLFRGSVPDESLAVVVSAMPSGAPVPADKLPELKKNFLAMARQQVKENKESLRKTEAVKAGAFDADLLVSEQKKGKEKVTGLRYLVVTSYGGNLFTFFTPSGEYKTSGPAAQAIMDTLRSVPVFRTIASEDGAASYEIPADFTVETRPSYAPDHAAIAMGRLLMTGLTYIPLSQNPQFAFFPESLDGITEEQEASLSEALAGVMQEQFGVAPDITFTDLGGRRFVRTAFDRDGDRTVSYICVKNGFFVSFDFIYAVSDADAVAGVIAAMVASIAV